MNKVLILDSMDLKDSSSAYASIYDGLSQRHNNFISVTRYQDVSIQIIGGLPRLLVSGHEISDDITFVIFRNSHMSPLIGSASAFVLQTMGVASNVPFLSQLNPIENKIAQLLMACNQDVRVPNTIMCHRDVIDMQIDSIIQTLGLPLIFKSNSGIKGLNNYLLHSRSELDTLIANGTHGDYIFQEFIPNDYDYRILYCGIDDNSSPFVFRRSRSDMSTHLNNTSQGGSAELVDVQELNELPMQKMRHLVQAIGMDVCGVDLLRSSKDNELYFLEINATPALASGAFLDEKLDLYENYLIKRAQGI
jgi:glutathione synthase/RimK-type ligase-like ATP-grasp enzyme